MASSIDEFVELLRAWAVTRLDIRGVALVGSHARGCARVDSDIDVLVLAEEPSQYVLDVRWVDQFGVPDSVSHEDWGRVQSQRVRYRGGPEVEFGVAAPDWATIAPIDAGTLDVVRGGMVVIHDPDGLLTALVAVISQSS